MAPGMVEKPKLTEIETVIEKYMQHCLEAIHHPVSCTSILFVVDDRSMLDATTFCLIKKYMRKWDHPKPSPGVSRLLPIVLLKPQKPFLEELISVGPGLLTIALYKQPITDDVAEEFKQKKLAEYDKERSKKRGIYQRKKGEGEKLEEKHWEAKRDILQKLKNWRKNTWTLRTENTKRMANGENEVSTSTLKQSLVEILEGSIYSNQKRETVLILVGRGCTCVAFQSKKRPKPGK
jgi:hypothetical protein